MLFTYALLSSQVLLVVDHGEEVSQGASSSASFVLIATTSCGNREVGFLSHMCAVFFIV